MGPSMRIWERLRTKPHFIRMTNTKNTEYGTASNDKNKTMEQDILGMHKKQNIDNIPAPFPKKKKKEQKSDDFDEWGFGDDKNEKNDDMKPINNGNKKKVESLLDFDQNDDKNKKLKKNNKEK